MKHAALGIVFGVLWALLTWHWFSVGQAAINGALLFVGWMIPDTIRWMAKKL